MSPVRVGYSAATASRSAATASCATRLMVQPPKPAPVMRAAATRMTGAGFGGCTINLVERGAVAALTDRVMADYPGRTGLTPRVYAVDAVAGAGLAPEG